MIDLSLELEPRRNAGQRARQVLRESVDGQLSDGELDDLMAIMTELVNNRGRTRVGQEYSRPDHARERSQRTGRGRGSRGRGSGHPRAA